MSKIVRLGNVAVDCYDEKIMQNFYASLLGWKALTFFSHLAVQSPSGVIFLFVKEDDFVPPVWPEEAGQQQKELHFDFVVSDVDAYVKKALELGGKRAHAQFGGKLWTTMLDPSGHPFCLCGQ